jgi:hypothetical protein
MVELVKDATMVRQVAGIELERLRNVSRIALKNWNWTRTSVKRGLSMHKNVPCMQYI